MGWLGDLLPGGHVDGFGERRSPRSVVGILSLRFDANKRKRKLRDGRSTYHGSESSFTLRSYSIINVMSVKCIFREHGPYLWLYLSSTNLSVPLALQMREKNEHGVGGDVTVCAPVLPWVIVF